MSQIKRVIHEHDDGTVKVFDYTNATTPGVAELQEFAPGSVVIEIIQKAAESEEPSSAIPVYYEDTVTSSAPVAAPEASEEENLPDALQHEPSEALAEPEEEPAPKPLKTKRK